MVKNIVLNIIKVTLMIFTILLLYLNFKDQYGCKGQYGLLIITTLGPIISYFMTKYKKEIKKGRFIYNVLRKIILFFTIVWLLVTGIAWLSNIFTLSFQWIAPTWAAYYMTIIFLIMIIEALINITTYKNNIIIPLCLISLLILFRKINNIYLTFDYDEYYIYFNSLVLLGMTLITWINGYIEMNRLKLKKDTK